MEPSQGNASRRDWGNSSRVGFSIGIQQRTRRYAAPPPPACGGKGKVSGAEGWGWGEGTQVALLGDLAEPGKPYRTWVRRAAVGWQVAWSRGVLGHPAMGMEVPVSSPDPWIGRVPFNVAEGDAGRKATWLYLIFPPSWGWPRKSRQAVSAAVQVDFHPIW